MDSNFETELSHLLGLEGGYSNNKNDRGGATNFGITEAVARANGYTGRMEDMTLADAAPIYRKSYWDSQRLDEIASCAPLVASELFDTGVNCGIGNSGMFLQRSLNTFSGQQRDYAHMPVDGMIGNGTIAALRTFIAKRGKRGEQVLLKAMNCLQGEYYIRIALSRPQNEDFEFGWFDARIAL